MLGEGLISYVGVHAGAQSVIVYDSNWSKYPIKNEPLYSISRVERLGPNSNQVTPCDLSLHKNLTTTAICARADSLLR